MRKSFMGFIIIFNLIAIPILWVNTQSHRAKVALPSYGQVADFSLMDQKGQLVTLGSFRGKPWVLDSMFTACGGACPVMSTKMSGLQNILNKEIRLVSITVDPERDSPERLNEYAKKYKAQDNRWFFLTGERTVINKLLTSLHLDIAEDPTAHTLRFMLIDSQGIIRGYYDSEDKKSLKKLNHDSRALLREERNHDEGKR